MSGRRTILAGASLVGLLAGSIGAAGGGEGKAPTGPGTGDESKLGAVAALRKLAAASPGGYVEGRDGWLFLSTELAAIADAVGSEGAPPSDAERAELSRRTEIVVRFARAVERGGARFLFVVIPPKAAIYPERVPIPAEIAEAFLESERGLVRRLESHGVAAVDLAERLERERGGSESLYCRQDTHWSSYACWRSAEAVAARLVAEGLWARSAPAVAAPEIGESVPRGDLWQLLPEPRPEREKVRLFQVPESPALPAGEGPAPVLVLGDSHAIRYRPLRAGFVHHLEAELGARIDLIAAEAGAGTQVRQALAREPGKLAGRRLVIWVIAARLIFGGPVWQEVPLPGTG